MSCCTFIYVPSSFANHLDGEKRAGCFAWFVFLVSRDCCFVLFDSLRPINNLSYIGTGLSGLNLIRAFSDV